MTDLLTEQGKTQSSLCDYLGIRSDMYSRWKKGESRSYMFDIGRIADFFGVSADYMAYRFFIAVNNPVVQELELKPFKAYYKGIYKLYPEWAKMLKSVPLGGNELVSK